MLQDIMAWKFANMFRYDTADPRSHNKKDSEWNITCMATRCSKINNTSKIDNKTEDASWAKSFNKWTVGSRCF